MRRGWVRCLQTPLIARFSTVIHEKGSPETLPDPRGFAVKFYTREGNFDMVGNNMPVFFVRDAMQVLHMLCNNKIQRKFNISWLVYCMRFVVGYICRRPGCLVKN